MTVHFGWDEELDDGVLEITCDVCGDWDEFEGGTFRQAFTKAKRYGWKAEKDEGDHWSHKCPEHNPPPLIPLRE